MDTNLVRVAAAGLLAIACVAPASAVDIEPFIKRPDFGEVKISPTGEYIAATVPMENTTAIAVLRLSDGAVTGGGRPGRFKHIAGMWWANDDRLLFTTAEKMGMLDRPLLTGDIYAMRANANSAEVLVGQSVAQESVGTRISGKRIEMVWATMVDTLPASPNDVVISVSGFSDDPYARAERMNVNTGRRIPITKAPVRNGRYVTDAAGVVRAAIGQNVDLSNRTFVRAGDGAEWTLLNDEASTGVVLTPLGFSADNRTLYLEAQRNTGTSRIEAYDMASGERSVVLVDEKAEPHRVIYDHVTSVPVGVQYMDGKPRTAFFDPASDIARQYRSLEAAFPGQSVLITSSTKDGKTVLVHVSSDRNPGDYYTFDTVAKSAAHVVSPQGWLDPETLAEKRPIQLTARDGLALAGYVTVPRGSAGKSLPMVVLPHGGPYLEYDTWHFDPEVQMLAGAGYAVLQVNFRGSGNHGRAFVQAGARQWGGTMQDDVTDATRWAIEQGIADPQRICIYGGSYGGYAALMGVAKEPSLYRCAVGYIGVYDLPMMHTTGDIQRRGSGETYLREWIGERDQLAAVSPTRMADRIKVPVFLAAGGEDERAPIEHTRAMERALKKAGVPVETLYFPNEGHGFYVEANRREYYTQLLAFLGQHLGGSTATAAK